MPLHLNPTLADSIRAHAAQDYPHECCGFLVGSSPAPPELGATLITRVVPAANTRQDSPRNRFEIDPGELVRVDRAARADGSSVVGFYHSHPDAAARPSEFDREHAWPGYCYVIVSVVAAQSREMRNWLLRDDRTQFDEDAIL